MPRHFVTATLGLLLVVSSAGFVAAAPAVVFGPGVTPDENLLFGDNGGPLIESGTTVTGALNNSGYVIGVQSTQGLGLVAPASGHAGLEAASGNFGSVTIFGNDALFPNFAITAAEFKIKLADTANALINLIIAGDGFTNFETGPIALHESGFMGVQAGANEFINSITIQSVDSTGAVISNLESLGQIRVSGVVNPANPVGGGTTSPTPTHAPEPASILTWVLISIAGLFGWRRRKLALR
jgi:hypothetical protein